MKRVAVRGWRQLWLLLALWGGGRTTHAQPARLQTFGARQGLTQGRSICLAQDSAGFLWIGTSDGLYRYDGVGFRVFQHRRGASNSLAGDEVLGLRVAANGQLLVGSLSGFDLYDPRTATFRRQPLTVPGQPPSLANWLDSFSFDAAGRLWIATVRGLLRATAVGRPARAFRADPKRPGALTSTQTRLSGRCLDGAGRLWIATVRGLHVYDPATDAFWSAHHNPRGWVGLQDTATVRTLTVDAGGRVWYSCWDQGLTCFDPATNTLRRWRHVPTDPTSIPSDLINCLTFDRAGLLWIGTLLQGAAHFDPVSGRCQRLPANPADPAALPSPLVNDIFEDRQGNVWFATDGGLALLSPLTRPFRCWRAPIHPVTAMPPSLGPVCPDAAGRLWVGTYSQGLLQFDAGTGRFRRVATPPLPGPPSPTNPHDLVWALAPAPNRRLWVGTQQGVLLFDPARETWEPLPAVLPPVVRSAVVSALLRARDGATWMATFRQGLVRYDPRTGTARLFRDRDLTGGDSLVRRISKLAQDSVGNIWVAGVFGQGVSRLAAGTWRVQTWRGGVAEANKPPSRQASGPADTDFYALLADAATPGAVWLGTHQHGLSHYVPGAAGPGAGSQVASQAGTFRTISRDDGLSSNFVIALAAVPGGALWVGTPNGLCQLSEPPPAARNAKRATTISTFGVAEGLPEAAFTGGAWADAGGTLWFTTDNYLLRIEPGQLRPNPLPPPVVLTDFQVNGRPRRLPAPDSMLTLAPGENTLAVEVAALNLLAPARNAYSWRLEGVDRRWSAPGPQRALTYANLPPGTYTLRVRAANNDGRWNRRGLTLRLHLLPPWYRTWWWYALEALTGAAILYAFYRQRLARAVALERARNQIARDLHDDIGSTLSSILMQSRVPAATVEQAKIRLQKISDYAQPMLQAMDEIVWAINPRFDPLPAVVARMRAFAAETLEPRGIELVFRATGPLDRHTLSLQRRREFYLIFKEAIHNAARYSEAQHVWVTIAADRHRLHLTIRDDGQGFDPAAPPRGSGNGLRNLRHRAQTLGARLTLESAPGQGTELVLVVG